ncbi:hypothetical protein ACFWM5_41125 [Streptomyces bobili]|uniref:hypothetical protein n=1 Tax=Streptomyces bobili TaxID=67280 RepID=UPI00365FB493
MISVPPLPDLQLTARWNVSPLRRWPHAQELRISRTDEAAAGPVIRIERCAAGRLRDTYPVAAHDVEIQAGACSVEDLPHLLTAVTENLGATDPRCRRLVLAVPADDLVRLTAAESAGFRYVVDVDLGTAEHSLLTWEPAWATQNDPNLDRVPGT